jgi:hypothetical protein
LLQTIIIVSIIKEKAITSITISIKIAKTLVLKLIQFWKIIIKNNFKIKKILIMLIIIKIIIITAI